MAWHPLMMYTSYICVSQEEVALMKTICFFSGDITRDGGTERVATRLASDLKKNTGNRIIFLSLVEQSNTPFFPVDPEIERFSLNRRWYSPGPAYLPMIFKLRRFLKERQVDIMIDIDIVLDSLSVSAAWLLPIKVISWEHFSPDYEKAVSYRRMILRFFTSRADEIVTLTEEARSSIGTMLGRKTGIHCIYNPMPDVEQDSSEKKKQILTIGHLTREKGIDMLLPIAKRFLKRHPQWTWVLAGTGEMEGSIRDYIKNNDLTGRLVLYGGVQDTDKLYSESAIYAMTSRMEMLPMVLLEAKAFSLPVISFNVSSGSSAIVTDGLNGYLIKPFDKKEYYKKLCKLAEDESIRKSFSEHASDNADSFSEETILKKWNSILS